MKQSNRFYLYLPWPKYLAQWYAHEMYRLSMFEEEVLPPYMYDCDVEVLELDPVKTRRGSAERNILETCLSKQPNEVPEPINPYATICIEIPNFLGKPAHTYNYLSASSRQLLEHTVRSHFRLELTKYMNKMLFEYRVVRKGASATLEKVLETFMENNGIEYNETNLEAIKQIWKRLYWKLYKQKRK
jgi:hypothetical protein